VSRLRRPPTEHIAEEDRGALAGRQMLDGGDEGQPYRLAGGIAHFLIRRAGYPPLSCKLSAAKNFRDWSRTPRLIL
jgi:hypothetical protein